LQFMVAANRLLNNKTVQQEWNRFCKFELIRCITMSVAEIKLAANHEISKLNDEHAVRENLAPLQEFQKTLISHSM
jgi:hypothetical protein